MLTKEEKITELRRLTASVTEEVVAKIESGKIPEEWDLHELRYLLALKFRDGVSSLFLEKRGYGAKRRKDCQNTILINNL